MQAIGELSLPLRTVCKIALKLLSLSGYCWNHVLTYFVFFELVTKAIEGSSFVSRCHHWQVSLFFSTGSINEYTCTCTAISGRSQSSTINNLFYYRCHNCCIVVEDFHEKWSARVGALIPIYNMYLILKIAGRPWWFLLLLLVPLVNIIVAVVVTHDVSKSFGKGLGFTLGLIFLPFIFYVILAWSDTTYQRPAAN